MKEYTVKPEYLTLWYGSEVAPEEPEVLTHDDILWLSADWSKPIDELLDEVDSTDGSRLWYAVQRDCEDDWGTGSCYFLDAVKMVMDNPGYYTRIAVIDNDVCISDYTLEEIEDIYGL